MSLMNMITSGNRDAFCNLAGIRFQGEVACVEEVHNRTRIVPLERLGAGGDAIESSSS